MHIYCGMLKIKLEVKNHSYDCKYSANGFIHFTKHDFLCVNTSNEAFPWYAPIPLIPTPPNGNDETVNL